MTKSDIEGKIALVTGASKGIGRSVAINYHTSDKAAEDVVGAIIDQGGEAIAIKADVSHLNQVLRMVESIEDTWGNIDILVNNAGIINDNLLVRMTDEAWEKVIATNLNGTFYCTRAVVRKMLRKRWGRIISIGSVVGIRGNIGQSNYAASKAGLIGFTKALAKEVASRNITVNMVTPGYISTDTVDVLSQDLKDKILTLIPQGHFGEVEDVEHMTAFLATQQANYITGQIISVDGGMAI